MSQNEAILNYLKPPGRTLTPMRALRLFNCWALSSRIAELNKPRRIIKSELVYDKKTKKTYAKYSLMP